MARQSSLDILRIIATFNVIWVHCSIFYKYAHLKKQPAFTIITYIFSKTCNYLFMLISGYIGCFVSFRISHVLNIVVETIIGGIIVVYIQCFFLGIVKYSSIQWLYILTPLAHNQYWYPSPFIFTQLLFYFIFPSALKTSAFKYPKYILIILFLLFMRIFNCYRSIGLSPIKYNISSFIIAFLLCPLVYHWKNKVKKYALIIFLVCFIYNYIIHYFKFPYMNPLLSIFCQYNLFEIPSLLLSISMLLVSLSIKHNFKQWRILQNIAELSYSIYLIGIGRHIDYFWSFRIQFISNMLNFSYIVFFFIYQIIYLSKYYCISKQQMFKIINL